ncbi:MAG: hypothetical protein FJ294_14035 [Planctomycetes bacterium]|nr:hypothetical protein [Planctomycetota bacterium]
MVERGFEVVAWREEGGTECVHLAVPPTATLASVHDLAARELRVSKGPWSCFVSGVPWDERCEFGSRGVDSPHSAERTPVAKLAWRPGCQSLALRHADDPEPLRLVVARQIDAGALHVLGRGPSPEPQSAPQADERGDALDEDDEREPGEEEQALGNWLARMVRFAENEPELKAPAMALATLGGDEFRGLSIPEALPLLVGDDSEMHFLLWAMLDFARPGEETIAQRYSKRWRSKGDALERAVLDRLVDSRLELIEIAECGTDGYGSVRWPLEPHRRAQEVQLGSDSLPRGLWAAARLIALDDEVQLLPGVLDFATREARELADERLRAARARSGLEWALFTKRDGHIFHRVAREALLAAGLARIGVA